MGHGSEAGGHLSHSFSDKQIRPAGEDAPNPFEGDRGGIMRKRHSAKRNGAEELLARTKQTSLHVSGTRLQHCPASKNKSYKHVMLAAF